MKIDINEEDYLSFLLNELTTQLDKVINYPEEIKKSNSHFEIITNDKQLANYAAFRVNLFMPRDLNTIIHLLETNPSLHSDCGEKYLLFTYNSLIDMKYRTIKFSGIKEVIRALEIISDKCIQFDELYKKEDPLKIKINKLKELIKKWKFKFKL